MITIIAGSRDIIKPPKGLYICGFLSSKIMEQEELLVEQAIKESGFEITEVVSGTARGADRAGERVAKKLGIPVRKMPANWDKFGKSAGYRRNEDMANVAEACIVITNGSKGSGHMIDIAKKKGLQLYVKNLEN